MELALFIFMVFDVEVDDIAHHIRKHEEASCLLDELARTIHHVENGG